jgi:hypothetical protein
VSTPGYNADTGLMDFSLALRELKRGKKLRRRAWTHKGFLMLVGTEFFWDDGKGADFIASALLADDWEEVL